MPTNMNPKEQIETIDFIEQNIEKEENGYIIMGGDLNIHLNHDLDSGNVKGTNCGKGYLEKIHNFMDKYDLIDIFRIQNETNLLCTQSGSLFF